MSALEKLKAKLAAAKAAQVVKSEAVDAVPAQAEALVASPIANGSPTNAVAAPALPAPVQPAVLEVSSVVDLNVENPEHLRFKEFLLELEGKLNAKIPSFAYQLRDIHAKMKADPSVVTAMSDEEIGLVIKGLALMKNEVIAPKSETGGKRASSKKVVTVDML